MSEGHAVAIADSGTIEEWLPTWTLRWFRNTYENPAGYKIAFGQSVLQQLWVEQRSGKQEWRDVPEVTE